MQKAEAQRSQIQNQPAQRQGRGTSLESPQGEQLAQLEAMAEASPQAAAQRSTMDIVANSPYLAAQRTAISAIHNSPNVTAQRRQLDSIAGETAQRVEASIQFSGREGDEWYPGPGQGESAPPTPRPGQSVQAPPPPAEAESLLQDGYSPRAREEQDDTAQLKETEGALQSKVAQREGIAQLASKYSNTGQQYSYVSSLDNKAKTAEVGLTMEAWLDPADIRGGQPSTDNSSQNEMMASIRKNYGLESTPGHVVKGHLLNEHIGGLADGDNLYPISKNANGVHSNTVETIAKRLVNSQPLYYKVSVGGTPDMGSATASFNTELREWDKKNDFKSNGNLIMNPPIYSDLGSPVGKQKVGMNMDAFDQRDDVKKDYF